MKCSLTQASARTGKRRSSREVLGNLGATGGMGDEPHANPEPREHVDQSVRAEQFDAPAMQIAHPWLRHPELLRRCGLGESARPDRFLEPHHEARTNQQVLGLVSGEAKIPEHVTAGAAQSRSAL